jgi:hypothetical protein
MLPVVSARFRAANPSDFAAIVAGTANLDSVAGSL